MKICSIELINFTNYEKSKCHLDPGFNIFIGDNGQGKSNLLDSIYYVAMERSARNHKDQDLIFWGRDYFKISASFDNKYGNNDVLISYDKKKKEKKEIILNNNKLEKIKSYIGFFNAVYFSPEDLYIIKGDPGLRRKYMDDELLQTEKKYYLCLGNYKKILDQRNALLKNSYRNSHGIAGIEVWEEQLSKYGTLILKSRLEMVDHLKIVAKKIHENLTDGKEILDVSYDTKLPIALLKSDQLASFQSLYFDALKNERSKDIERGYTSLGPHRDDLKLKINGVSARKFASQGQQRTTALSLKIAELELIKQKKNEYPILLLDDVLSELDKHRKNQLFSSIDKNIQTLITSTDLNDLDETIRSQSKIIEIDCGQLKER